MEFAVNFTENSNNSNKMLNRINKVRKHKSIYLPFELVGIDSHQGTNIYFNNDKASSLHWKCMHQDRTDILMPKDYQI